MQVKLYASLRVATGTKMIDVDVQPGIKIKDVLAEVTHRYPVLEQSIWKGQGDLSDIVHVFINGENILRLAGLETPVTEADHVDIFPPIVGG